MKKWQSGNGLKKDSLPECMNSECGGHLRTEEVIGYAQTAGLTPVRVKRIGTAKHIFSHVEWHMTGYELLVDELEKTSAPNVGQMCAENGADRSENIFVKIKQLEEEYAMPSAFDKL